MGSNSLKTWDFQSYFKSESIKVDQLFVQLKLYVNCKCIRLEKSSWFSLSRCVDP